MQQNTTTLPKILTLVVLCVSMMQPALASWQMFSDGKDTYIYNTQSGDIYIRYKKGGKNYEDVFVKMPAGILPNSLSNLDSSTKTPQQTQTISKEEQLEALKKSQEMLQQSIDSTNLLE